MDYHLITDLLPMLSKLYFLGRMPSTRMSHLQEAILLAMGLQHRWARRLRTPRVATPCGRLESAPTALLTGWTMTLIL